MTCPKMDIIVGPRPSPAPLNNNELAVLLAEGWRAAGQAYRTRTGAGVLDAMRALVDRLGMGYRDANRDELFRRAWKITSRTGRIYGRRELARSITRDAVCRTLGITYREALAAIDDVELMRYCAGMVPSAVADRAWRRAVDSRPPAFTDAVPADHVTGEP